MGRKRQVLFLCTGNSARSQMAEAWLRHLAGEQFDVASAGTKPVGLNRYAVMAMKEVGIDISDHRSKGVQELGGRHFDCVITVCDRAKEVCPIWPGTTSVFHWSFADPASATGSDEAQKAEFRRIRDEIGGCVRHFLADNT